MGANQVKEGPRHVKDAVAEKLFHSEQKHAEKKFQKPELHHLRDLWALLANHLDSKGKNAWMDKRTFSRHFFPHDHILGERMFEVMDRNQQGQLDWKEFILGLALTCKGPIDEKYRFVFQMIDVDNSGKIDRDEAQRTILSSWWAHQHAHDMLGTTHHKDDDNHVVEKLIDEAFKVNDLDGDGKLSLEEFTSWASGSWLIRDLIRQMEVDALRTDGDVSEANASEDSRLKSISTPLTRSISHLSISDDGGIDASQLSPKWKEVFREARISKSDLRDGATGLFLLGVIQDIKESEALKKTIAEKPLPTATVLYDFEGDKSEYQLSVQVGDNLTLVNWDKDPEPADGWVYSAKGEGANERRGYVPRSYIKLDDEADPREHSDYGDESEEELEVDPDHPIALREGGGSELTESGQVRVSVRRPPASQRKHATKDSSIVPMERRRTSQLKLVVEPSSLGPEQLATLVRVLKKAMHTRRLANEGSDDWCDDWSD